LTLTMARTKPAPSPNGKPHARENPREDERQSSNAPCQPVRSAQSGASSTSPAPAPPSSSSGRGGSARENPREDDRQENNASDQRPIRPAQSSRASSIMRTDSSSSRRVPPSSGRGVSGANPGESFARSSSASASRVDHRLDRNQQYSRSNASNYRTSDNQDRYGRGRDSSRCYDHHNDNRGRGNNQRYRESNRGDGRGDRDYNRSRSRDGNRGRRNDERYESSRGQDRDSNNQYSRDDRDRYEQSHHRNYSGQDYSRRHEHGQDDSRARCYGGPSLSYDSAPAENEHQMHKAQHEKMPDNASAPAKAEHDSYRQTNEPSPAPASYHSSFQEHSHRELTEKLKQELEREELKTKIAQKRLEKEKINLQLSQMKKSDAVQSENVSASVDVAQREELEAKIVQQRREKEKINLQSSQMKKKDSVQPENVAVASQRSNATRNDRADDFQHSINDDCLVDSDDDDDDCVQATRKSLKKKGTKRSTKAPKKKSKKKANHRTTGRTKLSESTKRKLREAQEANDEAKKHELLKAYEEDLAAKRSRNMHYYTEKDLMSTFTPEIIDHHLMAGGDGKFLVKWVATSSTPTNNDNCCLSWISHEDFLFPALARKYLSEKIKSKTCDNEIDGLKLWIEDCKEREQCLNCLNTFTDDEDEYENHLEIDFCCFSCKCKWNHPLKHTIRNCPNGLKYHRGCCHDYQDLDAFESFVSPVGKVALQLEEAYEEGETEKNTRNNPEAPDENVTQTLQDTNSVTIVDGDCESFRQCLQSRSSMVRRKQDAVVVCINAGVGSTAVSMKGLGIQVGKMIHVESDEVAQHVIRANHDYCYGEIDVDDGIDHIVGLYNSLADLTENTEKLVRKYGPIDMIICTTPRGKSIKESAQIASDFLELVTDIKRLNVKLHHFDHLFYLLESSSCIKDHLPLEGLSYCVCEPKNLYVCNWPISSQRESLLRADSNEDGLPQDYLLRSVTNLYNSLRKALCVGFDIEDSKWRDKILPQFWSFLKGPTGYDVKLNKGKFGPEAFLLHLRNPDNLNLSDVNYSNYLLEQSSSSIQFLDRLMSPIKKLFNKKDYGHPYNTEQSEYAGDTALHEHGGTSSPNSNNVAAAANAPVVKSEVVKEEPSTDDEGPL